MKRAALIVGPLTGLLLAATATSAGASSAAGPRATLDTKAIGAQRCTPAGSGAKQVVDVTFGLKDYADSGYVGEWAVDTVKRHLRIWRHADGSYCAQIQDDGSSFVTRSGPSPTGQSYVGAGIKGTFDGGYVTTDIVGKFAPRYPTHGDLGTFDAKCNGAFDCPGARPSWMSYFKSPAADGFASWGWMYDAGRFGTWLDQDNVSPPRGGDITGNF